MGWSGTHDKFHHEFTATVGDGRMATFEKFVSFAACDSMTLAAAAQGKLNPSLMM